MVAAALQVAVLTGDRLDAASRARSRLLAPMPGGRVILDLGQWQPRGL